MRHLRRAITFADFLGPGQKGRAVEEEGFEKYLDRCVEEALSPLKGLLSERELELVREGLRDALDSDPVVKTLVERALESASLHTLLRESGFMYVLLSDDVESRRRYGMLG